MVKKASDNPGKKSTDELFRAIEDALKTGSYYFTDHGEMRSITRRKVTDEEVVRILEGPDKWHERNKDRYEQGQPDWNYNIRGKNTDGEKIRIVVSFDEYGMPIIAVINLDED